MFALILYWFCEVEVDPEFYVETLGIDNDLVTFLSVAIFFAIPIGVAAYRLKDFMTAPPPSKLCTHSDDQVHSRTYARSELRA